MNDAEKKGYQDEDAVLYANPQEFVDLYFGRRNGTGKVPVKGQKYGIEPYTWPSHVAWFDNHHLSTLMRKVKIQQVYMEVNQLNTVFPIIQYALQRR
jgi:hypothetical protein